MVEKIYIGKNVIVRIKEKLTLSKVLRLKNYTLFCHKSIFFNKKQII